MNTNKTLWGTLIFSLFIHLGALFYSITDLQTAWGRNKEERLIVSFGIIEPTALSSQKQDTKKKELEDSIKRISPKPKNEYVLKEQKPHEKQVEETKPQDNKEILITKTLPEEELEDGYKLAKCNTDSQSDSFPAENQNPEVHALTKAQIEDIKTKFLKEVEAKIQKAKIYPQSAKISEIEGTAKVEFRLSDKGELLSVKLKSSSQYNILDEAAIHIVKRAAPFPKIPKELNVSNIELIVPIVFKLEEVM